MLCIVAKNTVPASNRPRFIQLASELAEASRREDGCLYYALHEDVADPALLTFIEFWRDEAAIDAHNASAHFLHITPQLAELRTGRELCRFRPL